MIEDMDMDVKNMQISKTFISFIKFQNNLNTDTYTKESMKTENLMGRDFIYGQMGILMLGTSSMGSSMDMANGSHLTMNLI